jgi:hypothetical protein
MLKVRLGTKGMPSNIFKLVAEDEGSTSKLKGLVDEATKVVPIDMNQTGEK